jgi:radical SAM protein with 4Fe4S-binding SPASM domain
VEAQDVAVATGEAVAAGDVAAAVAVNRMATSFFLERLTIQWHVTEACNRRCRHCYQKSWALNSIPYQILSERLENITRFIRWGAHRSQDFKAHINITGGEPFLFPELFPLLKDIKKTGLFSFGILSNGQLPSPGNLQYLKSLHPSFIQLSLDGNQVVHDAIRGEGAFSEVIHAISVYTKLRIPIILAFTANAMNFHSFPDVIEIARKMKVKMVWCDRYLPIKTKDDLCLTESQSMAFFNSLGGSHLISFRRRHRATEVALHRALQFLIAGGKPYHCSAGRNLLAISPDGDVYPCRRMPIVLGNIDDASLIDIYCENPVVQRLRSDESLDPTCKKCFYAKSCSGGLKCLSYAAYNDFHRRDPHCWFIV